MKKNANENFVIVNIPTFTPLLVTPQDLVFYDDPSKIAEQLTLIDMENYSRIEARQIISKNGINPNNPSLTIYVTSFSAPMISQTG